MTTNNNDYMNETRKLAHTHIYTIIVRANYY